MDMSAATSFGRSRAFWTLARTKFCSLALMKTRRPAVTFAPGTGARIEIDGKALLIEPEPMLLDHIALVAKGVWTRDGPPGVENTEVRKRTLDT